MRASSLSNVGRVSCCDAAHAVFLLSQLLRLRMKGGIRCKRAVFARPLFILMKRSDAMTTQAWGANYEHHFMLLPNIRMMEEGKQRSGPNAEHVVPNPSSGVPSCNFKFQEHNLDELKQTLNVTSSDSNKGSNIDPFAYTPGLVGV